MAQLNVTSVKTSSRLYYISNSVISNERLAKLLRQECQYTPLDTLHGDLVNKKCLLNEDVRQMLKHARIAAKFRQKETFREILVSLGLVNSSDKDNCQGHCLLPSVEYLRLLNDHASGMISLHLACSYGDSKCVHFLIEGITCDLKCCSCDKIGSCFHLITRKHCLSMLTKCMPHLGKKMCFTNALDYCGALYLAVGCESNEYTLEFQKWKQHFTVDEPYCPYCKDNYTCATLHYACKNGDIDAVKYLTSREMDHKRFCKNRKDGCTPLHYACKNGHNDIVKYLTSDMHCDPCCKDNNGCTPLHYAVKSGHTDTVQYLTSDMQCDPSCKDNDGHTPLHYAAKLGHTDIVMYMTDMHCDPSCKDKADRIPFHYAVKYGHTDIVKCLTRDIRCNPFFQDNDGCTPLHNAVMFGHTDIVKYLTSDMHCNPSCKDNDGRTPLHYAVKLGHTDIVKYLTSDMQCDPFCADNFGVNPFHYAVILERTDITKYYISNTACDILCKDKYSFSPKNNDYRCGNKLIVKYLTIALNFKASGKFALHSACRDEDIDSVKFLTEDLGCDPSCKDNDCHTLLHYASEKGHIHIVKYLTSEISCDPSCRDNDGHTPLHYASKAHHLDVVAYLIGDMSCDPFHQIDNVVSLFQEACLNGHTKLVKCLTNLPSKEEMISSFNSFKNTALHLACIQESDVIVSHLLEFESGIKCLTIPNMDGDTPLHITCMVGNIEVAKLLINTGSCDIHLKNLKGKTAVDYAKNHFGIVTHIRQVYGIEESVLPKVFVIGFSKSGKSTLVSSLQKESFFEKVFSGVPKVQPNTVGVSPINFHSSIYGATQLYDFAGHEEYHANHQLLFENTPCPIVLLLVDLSLSLKAILGEVKYWLRILCNSIGSSFKESLARIVIVGSHSDLMIREGKEECLRHLDSELKNFFSSLSSQSLLYEGVVGLDCRKSSSLELNHLRNILQDLCLSCRINLTKMVFLRTSILYKKLLNFLNANKMSISPACTVSGLSALAKKASFKVYSDMELLALCEKLSLHGKVLLLKDRNNLLNSWLVLDAEIILSTFHKSLKAYLTHLPDTSGQIACGLLSFSQLKMVAPKQLQVTIKYLLYAQICTKVDTESFSLPPKTFSCEDYYFFPHLVEVCRPSTIPSLSSDDRTPFYTWQLKCDEPPTPRFHHILLLQLTVPLLGAGDLMPPKYTIWKEGIYITSNDSTECIVNFFSQPSSIQVSIRCSYGNEVNLIRRRSQLINLILSTLRKNSPCITFEECIIEPQPSFCLNDSARGVPLRDVAGSIIENRMRVVSQIDSQHFAIDLNELLLLEPMALLESMSLKSMLSHSNELVPASVEKELLESLKELVPKRVHLKKIYHGPSDKEQRTFQELHDELKEYSIFGDRNLWEIAGAEMEPLSLCKLPQTLTDTRKEGFVLVKHTIERSAHQLH